MGSIDYVALQKQPWYLSGSRAEAEEILAQEEAGSFIIRPSSQPNCLALSHKVSNGSIGHALIHDTPQGYRESSQKKKKKRKKIRSFSFFFFVFVFGLCVCCARTIFVCEYLICEILIYSGAAVVSASISRRSRTNAKRLPEPRAARAVNQKAFHCQ
jgi:hypothetical protein